VANEEAVDQTAVYIAAIQMFGENFQETQEGRDFILSNYYARRDEK